MGIIAGALAFGIYVLFARVWLEILIVVFRIAENTRDIRMMMAEQGAAQLPPEQPQTAAPAAPAAQQSPESGVKGPAPEEVADETAEEDKEDEGLDFELQ